MKVKLLQFTPNPDKFCAKIARYSNVSQNWEALNNVVPRDGWDNLLRRIIKKGHTSVLEHAVFTFELTGISRVTTHQLVRHRIASYTQKSFRILRPKKTILPRSVVDATSDVDELGEEGLRLYKDYYRKGVPLEDARYLAPMGAETAIIVTMNARELREVFFPQRDSKAAQWEIRAVAEEMLKLVREVAPVIFEGI